MTAMKATAALLARLLFAVAIVSMTSMSVPTGSSASAPEARSPAGHMQFAKMPGVGV
jgi:hypothetical protein